MMAMIMVPRKIRFSTPFRMIEMEPKARPRPVPLACKSTRQMRAMPGRFELQSARFSLVLKKPVNKVESEGKSDGGHYKGAESGEMHGGNDNIFEVQTGKSEGVNL